MVRLGQALALAICSLTACGPAARGPEDIADHAIRSIYAGDVAQAQRSFDPSIRADVTPASVRRLSSVMHAFGNYEYVSEVAALNASRYDLEAQFAVGSMLVQMRLDGAGKIAALHVLPNAFLKKARR
jgi:hypothetical protein